KRSADRRPRGATTPAGTTTSTPPARRAPVRTFLTWQQAARDKRSRPACSGAWLRLGGRPAAPPEAARQDEQHAGADDREPRQRVARPVPRGTAESRASAAHGRLAGPDGIFQVED